MAKMRWHRLRFGPISHVYHDGSENITSGCGMLLVEGLK